MSEETLDGLKYLLLLIAGLIFIWLLVDNNNSWNECVDKHGEEWCRIADIKGEANSVMITELDN